jgi:small subunit ribosomal protein S20
VKGAVKKVREALENKSLEEAQAALQEAIPIIDKAASKGALHHRTAARRIARLSQKVHALSAEQE